MVSQFSFKLHFLMNNDAEHFYICLLTIRRSFNFAKCLSKYFTYEFLFYFIGRMD